MSQAQWRQLASVMAVMKGQINSCKRRACDVMTNHGEMLLGDENHKGTEMDRVGCQFYALAFRCEMLYAEIDRLTDLIRQNGDMPVLEKDPNNRAFIEDTYENIKELRKETKSMTYEETLKHLDGKLAS